MRRRRAIPFLVECWADGFFPDEQEDPADQRPLHEPDAGHCAMHRQAAWHGQLDLSISGTALHVPVPAGPHYSVIVNITSPMFRLTSDGKTPDCRAVPRGADRGNRQGGEAGRPRHRRRR